MTNAACNEIKDMTAMALSFPAAVRMATMDVTVQTPTSTRCKIHAPMFTPFVLTFISVVHTQDEDEEEVPAAGGEKVTFSHRLANLTNRFSKVSFQVIRVSSVDNNDQPRAKATVKRQPTGRKHTPRKG